LLEEHVFTKNVIGAVRSVQDLLNFLGDTTEFREDFFKNIINFHAITSEYNHNEKYDYDNDDIKYHFGNFNQLDFWKTLAKFCLANNVLFDLIIFDKSTVKFTSFTVGILEIIASLLKENGVFYVENSDSKIRYFNLFGSDTENDKKFAALVNKIKKNNFSKLFNHMISKHIKQEDFSDIKHVPLLIGIATTEYVLDDLNHINIAMEYNNLKEQEYKELIMRAKDLFKNNVDNYNLQIFGYVFENVKYCEGTYIDNNCFPIKNYYTLSHAKVSKNENDINLRTLLSFANI